MHKQNLYKYAFFMVHFILGFLLLWLIYFNVQLSFHEYLDQNLSVKTFVETAFLVSGVVLGNTGWDALKEFNGCASFSDLAAGLAKTTTPVFFCLIFTYFVINFVIHFEQGGFQWAFYKIPFWLIFATTATWFLVSKYNK